MARPHPRRRARRARAQARGALPAARARPAAGGSLGERALRGAGARQLSLVVLGALPDLPLAPTIQQIREGTGSRHVSILAMLSEAEAPDTEGDVLGGRRQRGAAAPARPRSRSRAGSAKLVDVPTACARAIPVQRPGGRQPRTAARRALLRPHPQPERQRHAAGEPRAPRGAPDLDLEFDLPGVRGRAARARPRRARGARGGLALPRLRSRVPVRARDRPAR